MLNKLKNYFLIFSTILAGILLTGAFAPFKIWPLAFITIAYLFYLWQNHATTAKSAFCHGFLFGISFFASAVSWVYISLYTFGGVPLWLSMILCAMFVLFLSLFPAFTGYLLNRIFTPSHKFIYLIAFSCLWVLMEWLRSNLFSGFPWSLLAFSQVNSPLAGFVPIVGEIGTSWLVCFTAGLLIYLCTNTKRLPSSVMFFSIIAGGILLHQITWTHNINKSIKVSAIQASVPQQLKWEPKQFKNNLDTYTKLTEKALGSDLIIWPESAVTLPMQYVDDYMSVWLNRLKRMNKNLLVGLPIQTSPDTYYNGLVVLGSAHGQYRKRHLVPFGEYPFLYSISQYIIQYFNIPMSNFTPGAKEQPLIDLGNTALANYICYEIAYESLVLSDLPKANVIINISDDSWFGRSLAAWQQVQIGEFRALETARYAVFATNDGITAVTDNKGKIIKKLPRYARAILTTTVYPRAGSTPMMWWGNWGMLLVVLIVFGIVWVLKKLELRRG